MVSPVRTYALLAALLLAQLCAAPLGALGRCSELGAGEADCCCVEPVSETCCGAAETEGGPAVETDGCGCSLVPASGSTPSMIPDLRVPAGANAAATPRDAAPRWEAPTAPVAAEHRSAARASLQVRERRRSLQLLYGVLRN